MKKDVPSSDRTFQMSNPWLLLQWVSISFAEVNVLSSKSETTVIFSVSSSTSSQPSSLRWSRMSEAELSLSASMLAAIVFDTVVCGMIYRELLIMCGRGLPLTP